jgi:hypothetical protein
MKYLSKSAFVFFVLLSIVSIGTAQAELAGGSLTEESPRWFGYTFKAHPSFGGSKYFESKDKGDTIQIKIIEAKSREIADAYIQDKLVLFKSIFEKKRVDYPGQHSKFVECTPEYKPQLFSKEIDGGSFSYFIGYANRNKVAGACVADLVYFKYLYGFLYCPQQSSIYEIEAFTDQKSEHLRDLTGVISCGGSQRF